MFLYNNKREKNQVSQNKAFNWVKQMHSDATNKFMIMNNITMKF